MPRIVFENVTKTFRAPDGQVIAAVSGVSLIIEDRELLVVVGPSGSGKTTLLRLLAGLETSDSGGISFGDQNVTRHPPQERDVAMVFQSHALFPHLTAFENIGLGLKLRGLPASQVAARVRETAEVLGVAHCLERPPGKLSGGERQRVAFARALVRQPKILLLDEPFSHLDEPLRAQLRLEIPALRARFSPTMIFVTHDQEEAMALGDRVAIMQNGSVQQVGTPREVYERPANRFVASFVGTPAMNLLRGSIAQHDGHLAFLGETNGPNAARFVLVLDGGRADWFGANIGRPILLGIRPEHIFIANENAGSERENSLEGMVDSVRFIGAEQICQLLVGGQTLIMRIASGIRLVPGEKVGLSFDWRHLQVFDAATGAVIP